MPSQLIVIQQRQHTHRRKKQRRTHQTSQHSDTHNVFVCHCWACVGSSSKTLMSIVCRVNVSLICSMPHVITFKTKHVVWFLSRYLFFLLNFIFPMNFFLFALPFAFSLVSLFFYSTIFWSFTLFFGVCPRSKKNWYMDACRWKKSPINTNLTFKLDVLNHTPPPAIK